MSLYQFQIEGAAFLAQRKRAYLADECGLGKTVQACYATTALSVKSVLVICPASAVENWYREWKDWGRSDCAFAAMSYKDRRLRGVFGQDWDLVIVDEAHYCKSLDAARTLDVLDIARKSERAWLLSATPMPNHPGELYAVIRVLWPHVTRGLGLETHSQWYNHFCRWVATKHGPYAYGAKNLEQLKPYLKEFMLRRTVEETELQLPDLRVDVSLLPRDSKFAEALEEYGADAEDLERRMQAESDEDGSTSRLRRLLGSYKAPRIADIIAEELRTDQYRKVVVLAYHRDTLDVFRQKLAKFDVVGFDGSTPQKQRQQAIDEFNAGRARVFVGQQTAAGVAINLQVSSEIVLVEPSSSPGDNRQAILRIRRIGSVRPCRARLFGVAASLDEGLMRRAAARTKMQKEIGL